MLNVHYIIYHYKKKTENSKMRSFSTFRIQAVSAALVVILCLHNVELINSEEISFYGDDGSIFTITISGPACYTFKSNYDKKAIAGDIERGCFYVWDSPGCRGEKRKLIKGAEELRDFKQIDFSKKISSVNLCSPEEQPSESGPSNNVRESKGSSGRKTLDDKTMQRVRDQAVQQHNIYRAKHGSPALVGDDSMHEEAQRYAEYLASNNKFELNRNSRYIGNIASSFRSDPEDAIKDAIARWYDGVNYYDFNNPGFSRQAGSFTAVVWKSSQKMGIGIAWNQFQNNWVIISYYAPSPNLQGAFRENVLPFSN